MTLNYPFLAVHIDGDNNKTIISIYMEKIYRLIDPPTFEPRYIGYTYLKGTRVRTQISGYRFKRI